MTSRKAVDSRVYREKKSTYGGVKKAIKWLTNLEQTLHELLQFQIANQACVKSVRRFALQFGWTLLPHQINCEENTVGWFE